MAELNEIVRYSMALENFGVAPCGTDKQKCDEDKRAIEIAGKTIRWIGERYEVGLPYDDENVVMERSLGIAFHHLKSVEKRLDRQGLLQRYHENNETYLEKGYAEELKWADVNRNLSNLWFLLHFPVLNPHKPEKLRIVFNSAAKSNGKCLNDYLLPGPPLGTELFGILCRFRKYPVAVGADIVEMFHQVTIREKDRWSQCFLWRRSSDEHTGIYRMKAMIFGANWSPFLAQFVKNYNAEQHSQDFPEARDEIINQHYVDDYYRSFLNVETALRICNEVIHVQQLGGFRLRNFISNNQELLNSLPQDRVIPSSQFDVCNTTVHRILGIQWDAIADQFLFVPNFQNVESDVISGKRAPTKREVLKIAMSLYDPLGFISPLAIKVRILIRYIRKEKISWDDEVKNDLLKKWLNWLDDLQKVSDIKIPRCILPYSDHVVTLELHTFFDASESAYSAVVYLRAELGGQYFVSLLASKARVTPL
ncbi:uncharacterized protein LOC129753240 [Uranotaenia lowii]|uniref:uncharacterized protein LOC129753240 n=1 Tax=Uranotaenia lowii TaxID=190385 RepID=UPI00247A75C3|nr:uncharacterized protein LOC129753240 [Uranotaenia lowii]